MIIFYLLYRDIYLVITTEIIQKNHQETLHTDSSDLKTKVLLKELCKKVGLY
jgi:hypothetical protein